MTGKFILIIPDEGRRVIIYRRSLLLNKFQCSNGNIEAVGLDWPRLEMSDVGCSALAFYKQGRGLSEHGRRDDWLSRHDSRRLRTRGLVFSKQQGAAILNPPSVASDIAFSSSLVG